MRITTIGAVVGLVLSALAVTTAPASGASGDPYWANRLDELTDASGATNGCTLRVRFLADDGPYASEPGVLELQSRRVLTCPESAEVHRVAFRAGLDILNPDGSVQAVHPLELQSRGRYDEPFLGGQFALSATACEGQTAGTHKYRARTVVRTWQTRNAGDTNPFVARAQTVRTVTCP